jgi:hypothetical protein
MEGIVMRVNDRLAGKNEFGCEEWEDHKIQLTTIKPVSRFIWDIVIQFGTPGENGSGGGQLRIELLDPLVLGRSLCLISFFEHVMDSPTTAKGQQSTGYVIEFNPDCIAAVIAL